MEAEIEAARLVGHPLVDGIAAPGSAGDLDDEPDPAFVTAEMEALTTSTRRSNPATRPNPPLAKALMPTMTNASTTSMLILRGLMIRRLPRRPSPNPPNRRPTNPKRPGMRSMICSLACVATATTTLKPSPSRSPRPSRKPSPRPTRTRRCEYEPRVSQRGPQEGPGRRAEHPSRRCPAERLGCHRRRRG